MKRFSLTVASGLTLIALGSPLHIKAQELEQHRLAIEPDVGLGFDFDAEELFFQFSFGFPLTELSDNVILRGHPSFDFFPFVENATLWALNLEAAISFFLQNATVVPFIGGGFSIQHASVDIGNIVLPPGVSASDTDAALLLRGGVLFPIATALLLDPNIYIRAGSGSSVGLAVAVRFMLGGT